MHTTTKILQYMFASLRDCVPLIKWSRHLESPQDLLTMFDQEVEGYLKDKVLDPLCRAVEEDLRLSSHLHLQLDDRNPYKVCILHVLVACLQPLFLAIQCCLLQ